MADIKYMVQECAKIGTLVYYMNQSDTAPLSEPGPWGNITNGYCAGLTVRWIRLAYAGKDYVPHGASWDGVDMPYFDGTDWMATAYQNKMKDLSAQGGTTRASRADYTLSLAQMQLGTELREGSESTPATGDRLSRVIAKSYGCYYTSLGGADSSHAIAFRHARPKSGSGPGEFHIFDPNTGHFMWIARAATWAGIIEWYLRTTGYKNDFNTAYLIGRATPPVNYDNA